MVLTRHFSFNASILRSHPLSLHSPKKTRLIAGYYGSVKTNSHSAGTSVTENSTKRDLVRISSGILACLTFPSGKLSNSPEMLSSSITPLSLQANINYITLYKPPSYRAGNVVEWTTKLGLFLGIPKFNSSVMLVNSQLLMR